MPIETVQIHIGAGAGQFGYPHRQQSILRNPTAKHLELVRKLIALTREIYQRSWAIDKSCHRTLSRPESA